MQRSATRPVVTAGFLVVAAFGVPLAAAHGVALCRAFAPPPPPPPPPSQAEPVSVAVPEPAEPVEPDVVQQEPEPTRAGLEARWGSSWYPVTALGDVCAGYVRYRFNGYGEEWDSVVATGDLRATGSDSRGLMPEATEAPDHLPLPANHRLRAGEALMVEWHGTWWEAHVVSTGAGETRVHYDGYESSTDETVTRDRLGLRVPGREGRGEAVEPSGLSIQGERIAVGRHLLARQGPSWLHARVTGFACGGLVRVHYSGRDASYDEYVTRDRLQRSTSTGAE